MNGIFASVAMWLAGRELGFLAFEALAQLWTIWGLTAVGVAFSFQQWEVARNLDLPREVRRRVPRQVKVALLVTALLGLAISTRFRLDLFGSEAWTWPVAVATLPLGTAMTGMAYATLARAGRQQRLSAIMVLENGVRLLATVGLVLVGAPAAAFAAAIPIGFLVAIFPLAQAKVAADTGAPAVRLTAAKLPGLAVAGFAKTFLLLGGPLLLGAAGGQATAVSSLFLILIIPRVPFLLVNALVPTVTVSANEAVAAGRFVEVRRWTVIIAGTGCCLALLAGFAAYALADLLAEALFAAGGQLDPAAYGLLGVTTGLVLALTLTDPLLIAMGRRRAVTVPWGVVVVSGTALTAIGAIAEPVWLTVWMSACAAAVLAAHLAVALAAEEVRQP